MAIIDMSFTFLLQLFNSVILLVIVIGIFIGVCFFQAFLSKKENKWLGLILPIFKISITFLIIAIAFFNMGANLDNPISISGTHRTSILMGLVFNIPTIVYLIIYFVCRSKLKNKNLVDKMKIKDL